MAKNSEAPIQSPNNIGPGTKIVGNIETTENFRIEGEIEGNIVSKGRVVIGTKGKVKGEVNCLNAEIEGVLEGRIDVKELLSLKATSNLLGDIQTSKLTIEPGAVFTGKCDMGGGSKVANPTAADTKK